MSLDLLRQLTFTQKNQNGPQDLAFEVAEMLINARTIKGITQKDLALKMGTMQSGIARAENGAHLPSLSFLDKMAKAYGSALVPPRFSFMGEDFRELRITTGSFSTHSEGVPKPIRISGSAGTYRFYSVPLHESSVQFTAV